jgi:hypothetical protein
LREADPWIAPRLRRSPPLYDDERRWFLETGPAGKTTDGEPAMSAAIRKAAPLALIAITAALAGCSAEPAPYYHGIDLFPQPSAFSDGSCCHDSFADHLGGGHR